MALNLGSVKFGLGVDTSSLGPAVKKLVAFQRTVDMTAQSTNKQAQAHAAAMRRQEKASASSLLQVLRFNAAVRRAGADPKMIRSANIAFRELTKEMTSGRLSASEFQRAMIGFNAALSRNRRALDDYRAKMRGSNDDANSFAKFIRNLSNTAVLAVGPLSGLGARITALASIANRADLKLAGLIGGVTAAGVAFSKLSASAVRTAFAMDQIEARLSSTASATNTVADQLAFLKKVTDQAGTEFATTAKEFSSLQSAAQGTALEGEKIRKVFEDVTFATAAFRLDAQQTQGVMRALEQIMSKGSVQAEELRNQLGDRLPGAFQIAARSMGVTTQELNKMLKQGQVASEEFLPAFARELRKSLGGSVTEVDSLQASLNRLNNAAFFFSRAFDEAFGISKIFQAGMDGLTAIIETATDNMGLMRIVTAATFAVIVMLTGPAIIRGFMLLGRAIKSAAVAMFALNTAATANPFVAMLSLLFRIGAVLAAAAVGMGLFGAAMADTAHAGTELSRSIDEYIRMQEDAATAESMRTGAMRSEVANRISLIQNEMASLQSLIDEQEALAASRKGHLGRTALGRADKARDALDALQAEIDLLEARGEALARIQEAQARLEEEARQREAARLSDAQKSSQMEITRLQALTAAAYQAEGTVDALNAQFSREDELSRFREALTKAGEKMEEVTRLSDIFAQALDDQRQATEDNARSGFFDALDEIGRMVTATEEGARAVAALNDEISRDQELARWQQTLVAAGVSLEEAATLVGIMRLRMKELDDTAKTMQIDAVIESATQKINRMLAEVEALGESAEAVETLKQSFDDADEIEQFRQMLEDAGVQTSILEGLVWGLTGALRALRAAAASARVDAALEDARGAIDAVKAETAALNEGKEAYEAYQTSSRINSQVDAQRKSLEAAGVSMEEQTAILDEYRTSLETLAQSESAYQAKLDAAKGKGKGGGGKKTDKEENNFQKFLESMRQTEAEMKQQLDMIGKSEREVALLAERFDLLAEAKEKQIPLDRKVIETGLTVAETIEQQAQKVADLQVAYDQAKERTDFLVSAQNDLKEGMLDAILEGENLADTLASLAKAFARAALEAALFNSGPFGGSKKGGSIWSAIGSVFSFGKSSTASAAVPKLAKGTSYHSGGPAIVGDGGEPELLNLPRGSRVTPMSDMQGGGGVNLTFAPVYNMPGADVAAVKRLEDNQRQMAAEFESRVNEAIERRRRYGLSHAGENI